MGRKLNGYFKRLTDEILKQETVNRKLSECSKEYKTRHELIGKETYQELCKKFQFDYTTKWYM